MAWNNLIADIESNIRTNGVGAITGALLQDVLIEMIGELSSTGNPFYGFVNNTDTYTFNEDGKFFVITSEGGTYENIGYDGALSVLSVLTWDADNATWVVDTTLADVIGGLDTRLDAVETAISGTQAALTAGDGIELQNNVISVKPGSHITVDESGVNVETTTNISEEPAKIPTAEGVAGYVESQKNTAGGVAGLDDDGKVTEDVLPDSVTLHEVDGDVDDEDLYNYYQETVAAANRKIDDMRVALALAAQSLNDIAEQITEAGAAVLAARSAAEDASTSATSANTAANLANDAAGNASGAAVSAGSAASAANAAATLANAKAGAANDAATSANSAAQDANDAATLANAKAGAANDAAALANEKAGDANDAAQRAEDAYALIADVVVHEEADPDVYDMDLYNYYQETVAAALRKIEDMNAKMDEVDDMLGVVAAALADVDVAIENAETATGNTNAAIENANNAAASVESAKGAAISAANNANTAASAATNAAASAANAATYARDSVSEFREYLNTGVMYQESV